MWLLTQTKLNGGTAVQYLPTPVAPESLRRPQNMTADMEPATETHPEQGEERRMKEEQAEGEMWTTAELMGDDWRLRYDRSTPARREREVYEFMGVKGMMERRDGRRCV